MIHRQITIMGQIISLLMWCTAASAANTYDSIHKPKSINSNPHNQQSNTNIINVVTSPNKVDFRQYLAELKHRIVSNGVLNKLKRPIVVSFKIRRDGEICDTYITHSSSNRDDDDLAFKTITGLNPFLPLPSGSPYYVLIDFVFDQTLLSEFSEPAVIVEFGDDRKTLVDSYLVDLKQQLRKTWYPPKDFNKSIQVSFDLHRNGNISGLKVLRSSGILSADKSALDAIKKAAPFNPTPSEMEDPYKVVFTFNYYLFRQEGTGSFAQFQR